MKIDHEREASIIGNLQETAVSIVDLKRCIADLVDCWNIQVGAWENDVLLSLYLTSPSLIPPPPHLITLPLT